MTTVDSNLITCGAAMHTQNTDQHTHSQGRSNKAGRKRETFLRNLTSSASPGTHTRVLSLSPLQSPPLTVPFTGRHLKPAPAHTPASADPEEEEEEKEGRTGEGGEAGLVVSLLS